MKKYFANILSAGRIIIASVLLWYSDITAEFIRLFCLARLTDLLDGPIARLTKSVSELGAKLDTYVSPPPHTDSTQPSQSVIRCRSILTQKERCVVSHRPWQNPNWALRSVPTGALSSRMGKSPW